MVRMNLPFGLSFGFPFSFQINSIQIPDDVTALESFQVGPDVVVVLFEDFRSEDRRLCCVRLRYSSAVPTLSCYVTILVTAQQPSAERMPIRLGSIPS